jgi:prevent-host-death family protein
MTANVLSKSQLKAKLLGYLRQVEHEHTSLIITHDGKPVLQIAPYPSDPRHLLRELRGSVVSYVHPTDTVGKERKAGETVAV